MGSALFAFSVSPVAAAVATAVARDAPVSNVRRVRRVSGIGFSSLPN